MDVDDVQQGLVFTDRRSISRYIVFCTLKSQGIDELLTVL